MEANQIHIMFTELRSWTLTSGQHQNFNVCFNSWVRAMSRMTKWDLRILSIRDEELRKRLGIESLGEFLDCRCMKNENANMLTTLIY